jgi:transposase
LCKEYIQFHIHIFGITFKKAHQPPSDFEPEHSREHPPRIGDRRLCRRRQSRSVYRRLRRLARSRGGRVQTRHAEGDGRPGYAPGDLLKLYIYGYLNRVRSSRRLEAECHRNIEVIWLLRTSKPDFKTIADFRSDNRAAFRAVFRQFTLLCRELNLFGRELLAVDGTRIKAVNNKDRNFTKNSLEKFIKAADRRLDEYLKRLDEGDVAEAASLFTRGTR